jgi:hypothetical protein
VTFREPTSDPFVNTTLHLGWRTVLREVLRWRRLQVTFIVDGDIDRVNDVMELDANTLITNSTRRDTWNSHLNERLAALLDWPDEGAIPGLGVAEGDE